LSTKGISKKLFLFGIVIAILASILFSVYVIPILWESSDALIEVKQGDWIDYQIDWSEGWNNTFPWERMEIITVRGTYITYYLTTPKEIQNYEKTVDIANDYDELIIPAHSDIYDKLIFIDLTISKKETRIYDGLNRETL
jgi:hypothetical protein